MDEFINIWMNYDPKCTKKVRPHEFVLILKEMKPPIGVNYDRFYIEEPREKLTNRKKFMKYKKHLLKNLRSTETVAILKKGQREELLVNNKTKNFHKNEHGDVVLLTTRSNEDKGPDKGITKNNSIAKTNSLINEGDKLIARNLSNKEKGGDSHTEKEDHLIRGQRKRSSYFDNSSNQGYSLNQHFNNQERRNSDNTNNIIYINNSKSDCNYNTNNLVLSQAQNEKLKHFRTNSEAQQSSFLPNPSSSRNNLLSNNTNLQNNKELKLKDKDSLNFNTNTLDLQKKDTKEVKDHVESKLAEEVNSQNVNITQSNNPEITEKGDSNNKLISHNTNNVHMQSQSEGYNTVNLSLKAPNNSITNSNATSVAPRKLRSRGNTGGVSNFNLLLFPLNNNANMASSSNKHTQTSNFNRSGKYDLEVPIGTFKHLATPDKEMIGNEEVMRKLLNSTQKGLVKQGMTSMINNKRVSLRSFQTFDRLKLSASGKKYMNTNSPSDANSGAIKRDSVKESVVGSEQDPNSNTLRSLKEHKEGEYIRDQNENKEIHHSQEEALDVNKEEEFNSKPHLKRGKRVLNRNKIFSDGGGFYIGKGHKVYTTDLEVLKTIKKFNFSAYYEDDSELKDKKHTTKGLRLSKTNDPDIMTDFYNIEKNLVVHFIDACLGMSKFLVAQKHKINPHKLRDEVVGPFIIESWKDSQEKNIIETYFTDKREMKLAENLSIRIMTKVKDIFHNKLMEIRKRLAEKKKVEEVQENQIYNNLNYLKRKSFKVYNNTNFDFENFRITEENDSSKEEGEESSNIKEVNESSNLETQTNIDNKKSPLDRKLVIEELNKTLAEIKEDSNASSNYGGLTSKKTKRNRDSYSRNDLLDSKGTRKDRKESREVKFGKETQRSEKRKDKEKESMASKEFLLKMSNADDMDKADSSKGKSRNFLSKEGEVTEKRDSLYMTRNSKLSKRSKQSKYSENKEASNYQTVRESGKSKISVKFGDKFYAYNSVTSNPGKFDSNSKEEELKIMSKQSMAKVIRDDNSQIRLKGKKDKVRG
eukprot:CAMPEP_0170537770 /NCGR_PEP_ID=MMETSP0209-20121228/102917_1 /TAXON_ID=665100 ORGANISM="Litonotus pictus, Strain P1" /NCGR_SAMPLE_ID=MMETSP0209 /ASSEMBLY_ACC=CAM_ASM_000301 /LENGTH=1036 /DNA_ID=CAMNT_0010839343 /DNA_START=1286 /DNA_END=4393 /DNA_ORIENTATION=+